MGVAVERLEPDELVSVSVEVLGLDPDAVDLVSTEALAASVRRAASFMCPTTPGALARGVVNALAWLPGFSEDVRLATHDTVQALVSYGDLLELPLDDSSGKRRHVFLGPPSYVLRENGCLLVGIRPDGEALVSEELLEDVEAEGHTRILGSEDPEALADSLRAEGLNELSSENWTRPPRSAEAREIIEAYTARLRAAGPAGEIEGLSLIDPAARPDYYRGRWRPVAPNDEGDFVARRPQAFGADLWCFAEVQGGEATKLVDLPVESPLAPGSDEAWRLQAALDAERGHPQRLSVRPGPHEASAIMDVYAPLPSWARRRLDLFSTPVERGRGALFSYCISRGHLADEVEFLGRMMWLSVDGEEATVGGG